MPCQTQTSQQPQQPTTVLPQNLPKTQADWQRFLQRMNELLGSINNAQYATGVNAVPTDYAVYDGTGLPALRITGATSAFDTTHAQFGSGSLKLTATASTVTVELGASGYPVTLHPNWQWIASLFLLTSVTTIAGKLSIVTAAKQYDTDISGSPGASWSRLYGDYDLTADASTSCTLLLTLTGVTVGQVFNLEGWMVEPSQGAVLPSPFIMTSGPRTWAQVVNDGNKPQDGADVTAFHTAADTAAVNGVPAATVNTNITTAQTTANTANANTPPVLNPQFANGTTSWSVPNIGWYEEAAGSTHQPDPIVSTYCVHAGSTVVSNSLATDVLANTSHLPVVAGQQVSVACCVRELSVNAGALAYARISWRDINNTEIATSTPTGSAQYPTCGAAGTGTYTQCVTKITAASPAGAQYAVAELVVAGHTSGYFTFCNVVMGIVPSTVDEVPDGITRVGSPIIPGAGTNVVANPAFVTSAAASENAGTPYSRWQAFINSAGAFAFVVNSNAADPLSIRLGNGINIPANTTYSGYVQNLATDIYTFSVAPGESYYMGATAETYWPNGINPGLNIECYCSIAWFDRSGNFLINSPSNVITSALSGITSVSGTATAPANAAFGKFQLKADVINTSASSVTTDGAAHYFNFGNAFCRKVSNLDNEVSDGGIFARIYGSELSSGRHRIGVVGSGYRVGDQRNLLQRTITNYPSKVSPGVSYSAAAGTPATATISVAAFTALLGSVSVAYNAASVSVTGTNGTNVNYYLFFNDPTYSGGTQTLVATTNQNDLYSGDGYVYVGYVTVAFPSSGSGSGGGTGCPLRTAWVIRRGRHGRPQHVRAAKVRVGDWLLRTDGEWAEVTFSRAELQPCVRLVADGFGTLGCSVSAPMQLREGSALSIACLAREVAVSCVGARGHAVITELHDLGDQWVQHITLANAPDDFFWTGDAKDALFGHHNAKPP